MISQKNPRVVKEAAREKNVMFHSYEWNITRKTSKKRRAKNESETPRVGARYVELHRSNTSGSASVRHFRAASRPPPSPQSASMMRPCGACT